MSGLTTLLAGAVFGVALAAPPGPMNAIIAEESVLRGWTAGFKAGLGAATADLVFFLLAAIGVVAVVEQVPLLRAGMVGTGGVLMCYFAYSALRDAGVALGEPPAAPRSASGFKKAFLLALTNPYQLVFWLTVGVGLLEPGRIDLLASALGAWADGLLVVETGTPWLLVGLFAGIGVWITGFPAALVAARQRVQRLSGIITYGSAVLLAGFGIVFLRDAALTLGVL
jgi:threonine/homoserine/homoserine lactone efflux protein